MPTLIPFERFEATLNKNQILSICEELKTKNESYIFIKELALSSNEGIAFRASWVLENMMLSDPEWIKPNVLDFLDHFAQQRNDSSMRHYYKILAWLTAKKQKIYFNDLIRSYAWDSLINLAFQDLLDEKIKVAVKSQAISFLAHVCWYEDWIKAQLEEVMDWLMEKESIAFFAKVKMIKKQLKRYP